MVGEGSISWTVGFAGIEQAKAAWVAYRQEVAATIQAQGQLVQTMGGGGQVLATIASNAATAAKNYQALTGSLSQLSAGFSQVTSSGSGLSGALANVAAQAKTTQQAMSTLPTTIQAVFKAPAGGGAISGQMRLLNADLTALKANAASGVAPLANISNSLNQIGPASANAAGGMQRLGQGMGQLNTQSQGAAQGMSRFTELLGGNRGLVFGLSTVFGTITGIVAEFQLFTDANNQIAESQAKLNEIIAAGGEGTAAYDRAIQSLHKDQRFLEFATRNMVLAFTNLVPEILLITNGIINLRARQVQLSASNAELATTGAAAAVSVRAVGPAAATAAVGVRTLSTAVKGLMISSGIGAGFAIGGLLAEFFMSQADAAKAAEESVHGSLEIQRQDLSVNSSDAQKWAATVQDATEQATGAFETHATAVAAALSKTSIAQQEQLVTQFEQQKATAMATKENAQSVVAGLEKQKQAYGQTKEGVVGHTAAIAELNRLQEIQNTIIHASEVEYNAAVASLKDITTNQTTAAASATQYNDALALSAASTEQWNAAQALSGPIIANISAMIKSGQITSLEQLNATMAIATGGWDTYAKSSTDAAGIVEVASNQVKAAFQGVFQTSAQIQKEFNKTQVEADKLAKGLIDLEQTFGVDLPTSVASSEESLKAAGEALKQFQKDTEPLRDISGLEKAFKLKIDAEDDVKEFLKGLPKGLEKEIKFNINVASNIKEFKEIFDILSAGLFEQQGLEIKLKPNFDASEAEKIAKEFMHTIEDHFGKEGKNSTLMADLFADLKASIKAGTIQQDIVGIFQDHGFLAKVDQAAVGIGNTVAQGVSKGIIDLQTRAPTAGDKASQERLKKQFQGQPQGPDESFKLDEIDQPAVIPAPVKDPNFDTNIQQAKTDIASVSTTPQTPVVIPAPDSTEFVNAMNTLLAVPADFNARMAAAFTSTPLVIPAPDATIFADAMNTLLLIPEDFATRFNESFGKNGLVVPAPVIDEFIAGLDQASTNAAAFIETFNSAMGGGGGGGKKKKKGGGGLVIPAPNIEQYVGGMVAAIEIATQFPQAFTDSFGKEGLMIPAPNIDEFIAGLDLASTAALGFIETFNNAMGGGGSGGGAGGGKKKKKKGGGGLIIPAPDSAQFVAGIEEATSVVETFVSDFTSAMEEVVSGTEEGTTAMEDFGSATDSAMSDAASAASDAASDITSSFDDIASSAEDATSAVEDLQSAIDSLHDKTVTVTYKQKGKPAQHGFEGTVSEPTLFLIGEHGSEHFSVKPTYNAMDEFGRNTGVTMNLKDRYEASIKPDHSANVANTANISSLTGISQQRRHISEGNIRDMIDAIMTRANRRIEDAKERFEDRFNKIMRHFTIPIDVQIDRQSIIRIVKEGFFED